MYLIQHSPWLVLVLILPVVFLNSFYPLAICKHLCWIFSFPNWCKFWYFLCIFFMSQLLLSIHWPTLSLTCPFFHRTQSENCFHFLSILHFFGIFPNYNCHFTDRLFSETPFHRRHSVTEVLQMQCNWSTLSHAFVFSNPPSQFSSNAQFLSETSLFFGTI